MADPVPEMVERVAREMYAKTTDTCRADNGTLTLSQTNRGSGFDSQPEAIKQVLRSNARAAIGAMREPTIKMAEAAEPYAADHACDQRTIWALMINAALEG